MTFVSRANIPIIIFFFKSYFVWQKKIHVLLPFVTVHKKVARVSIVSSKIFTNASTALVTLAEKSSVK